MATANEMLNIYILEYQAQLYQIRVFELEHPENTDGFNALVETAENIKLRAEGAGAKNLPPLPKRK
ncbi:MAG: hypothetical protein LBL98_02010 [Ruminococcus sp.]|jgi:hypothetical protein|nr:hypothetical protein [Ruminococcus sp.]